MHLTGKLTRCFPERPLKDSHQIYTGIWTRKLANSTTTTKQATTRTAREPQSKQHPPHTELLENAPKAFVHPSTVSYAAMAWGALSEATRKKHLKWIQEIRSMPADLLHLPTPTAILEMLRRMAFAKRWRWRSIARTMAEAQTALLNLSLYKT
jgi:hypothetical protein